MSFDRACRCGCLELELLLITLLAQGAFYFGDNPFVVLPIFCYNRGTMNPTKISVPEGDPQEKMAPSVPEVAPVAPEKPSVPEVAEKDFEVPEKKPEIKEEEEVVVDTQEPVTAVPTPTPVAIPPKKKDRLDKEIESMMEEDLTEMFLSMTPEQQLSFKVKGEETASKVREIIGKAKVNAKKVFQLIRDWLQMIPGVNKIFLEQEAKIKTDKILLMAQEEEKRRQAE